MGSLGLTPHFGLCDLRTGERVNYRKSRLNWDRLRATSGALYHQGPLRPAVRRGHQWCSKVLPAAVGVRLILEDKIKSRGVLVPVLPEIYEPALVELERLGIHFSEETVRV